MLLSYNSAASSVVPTRMRRMYLSRWMGTLKTRKETPCLTCLGKRLSEQDSQNNESEGEVMRDEYKDFSCVRKSPYAKKLIQQITVDMEQLDDPTRITSQYFCTHIDTILEEVEQKGICFLIVDEKSGAEVILCPSNEARMKKIPRP